MAETIVVERKPFWQSLSFRGLLVTLIPILIKAARASGAPVPEIPAEELADIAVQLIGSIVTLIGIFRRKDIKLGG
jgi:hypothetical protein